MNLGKDSIFKTVLKLALPQMFAQFVAVFYSIADRIFISQIQGIGGDALAGVGVCAPILTLLTSFAYLCGLGGAPLVAMKMGEGKDKDGEKIMSNAFLLLLGISFVLTIFVVIFKDKMLLLFGASEKTFHHANDYLSVYIFGIAFGVLSVGMNSFVVCQGYSKTAMFSVLLGAVLNLILDPIFIFALGMGVRGGSLATVISQGASCLFILAFLMSNKPKIRLKIGSFSKSLVTKILKLGASPFIIIATDSVLIILFNAVLQKTGGELCDTMVTAGTIVVSFMQIITMPMGGITLGCQPLLAFNYGARNSARVKKGFLTLQGVCLAFCLIMEVVAIFWSKSFVGIFTSDEAVASLAIWGIKIYTMGIIILAVQYATVDSMVALGQAKHAVAMSLFRKVFMMVLIILLPTFFGAAATFFAEGVADIVSGILSGIIFALTLGKVLKRREKEPLQNL